MHEYHTEDVHGNNNEIGRSVNLIGTYVTHTYTSHNYIRRKIVWFSLYEQTPRNPNNMRMFKYFQNDSVIVFELQSPQ